MTRYYIIPGLGNSGPQHWQTYFENSGDNFSRIHQQEWDAPVCNDWVMTIERTLADVDLSTVILIGHSLGCATIAHWINRYKKIIKGALLVAPSDVESSVYTFPVHGFAPMPTNRIPFKTIVVASEDDQWISMERAKLFATNWGSELINIGKAGHINTASDLGAWPEGMKILRSLDN